MDFDNLPDGWELTKIGDIVLLHDKHRIPLNAKERETKKGIYPYYGANGKIDSINDYIFDGEYILLAEDGGYFDNYLRDVAYFVNGKFWVNNHAHIVSTLAGMPNKFLMYGLNSINWMPYVGGSTRLKLTQNSLINIPFLLPPLNEQRRIVTKIEALNAHSRKAREALADVPQLIEQFKQSVLAAAFRGDLTADWREKNHITISSTWLKTTLNDVIYGKPRNGYSPKAVDFPTQVKSLTLTATTSGIFKPEHYKYIDEIIDHDSYLWLTSGDILIQRSNTLDYVGNSAIYNGRNHEFIYPDLMMKIQIIPEKSFPEFIHFQLSSRKVKDYFKKNATGTAGNMPKINQKTVMETPIFLPSIAEQQKIVNKINRCFLIINLLEIQYKEIQEKSEQLDQSILAKAFRGELVPQDPNDEPAAQLLERIKAEREQQKPAQKTKRQSPKKDPAQLSLDGL
jgi:type I restriction enzyme S subunit